MSAPLLSVLVRTRDEASGIGPLLDALRSQTLGDALEIVVIDSGSRDGTLEQVRARGIEPLLIEPERFSYGRALNVAADASRGDLCAAVSGHALPEDSGWAQRLVGAFGDDRVACAFGERVGPNLEPLSGPLLQDSALALAHPFYGYSNSAGGFRRELWAQRPFDEELPASEDKEWARHWLERGWLVCLDPALAVRHSHDDEGPLQTYRRTRLYFGSYRSFAQLPALGASEAVAEWWRGPHRHRSAARSRLDPRRAAMLAGKWAALRHGSAP